MAAVTAGQVSLCKLHAELQLAAPLPLGARRKQENEKAQGPVIVTETPQEPKTPPAVEPAAVDEEEPNFSGDDDEPHSPKSPGLIFV